MSRMKDWLKRAFGRASAPGPQKDQGKNQNLLTAEQRQEMMGTSGLSSSATSFRAAWKLIKPYWSSEEKTKARLMLGAVIGLSLAQVGMNIVFNDWSRDFGNSLMDKDAEAFKTQLQLFGGLAAAWMGISVYRAYLTNLLHINWRDWMTKKLTDEWMDNKAYYRLQTIYQNADNPQNRISKDVNQFTGSTLNLSMGLMRSTISLPSFLYILWGLSGTTNIPIGGTEVAVPGLMVWVALGYAGIGTWLSHKVGRSLIDLNFSQEQKEADFEYGLTRVRENAEAIALYGGENAEKISLKGSFSKVISNSIILVKKQKNLDTFNFGYNQAAVVFPYIMAAPAYFTTGMKYGQLSQAIGAFGNVREDLSWFVDAYSSLATWKAVSNRLTTFQAAIDQSNQDYKFADKLPAPGVNP